MIIVSQDKEEIVNFDKVDSIWICSDEEDRFTVEAAADTNATLGYYKTKERAKEVLQEIVELYKNQANQYHYTSVNNVYEMPEE